VAVAAEAGAAEAASVEAASAAVVPAAEEAAAGKARCCPHKVYGSLTFGIDEKKIRNI
jgi:hypothetical protein